MKLNFGCGNNIKKGFVNVDIQEGKEIDKSFDFNVFPYPYENNTFDYILIEGVLHHLDDPPKVLNELRRISRNRITIEITEPYYNCTASVTDLNHKHYFNDKAFDVFVYPEKWYGVKPENKFEILELDLLPTRLGKLIYPKTLRRLVSYVIGEIINEIHVELVVLK